MGHINYGTSFMGRLYYPMTNRDGCSPFTDSDFKEDTDNIGNFADAKSDAEPIIMLDHGECTHVHKTKMAQDYGFKAVIIVDETLIDDYQELRLSQDGMVEENKIGYQLNIPYFKIFAMQGAAIQTQYNKGKLINIQVDLGLDSPDNRVEYELWYSSVFDLSEQQLTEMAQYQSAFGNNTLFTPRIVTFECMNCPESIRQQNCVSDGRYCPYQPIDTQYQGKFEDQVIIEESLREKCLYKELLGEEYRDGDNVNYDLWFRYMLSMRKVIDSKFGLKKEISIEILKKLGFRKNVIKHIEQCVEISYNQTNNNILSVDRKLQNLMRVTTHPTITINNETYIGDIDGQDLAVALCASYKDRPEVCHD